MRHSLILLASVLALLSVPASPLSAQPTGFESFVELPESPVPGKAAVNLTQCDGDRSCSGPVNHLLARVQVQPQQVRIAVRSEEFVQLMTANGCQNTTVLWLNNSTGNRDLMLDQMIIAEKYGDTVTIVFDRNPGENHCHVSFMSRVLPPIE